MLCRLNVNFSISLVEMKGDLNVSVIYETRKNIKFTLSASTLSYLHVQGIRAVYLSRHTSKVSVVMPYKVVHTYSFLCKKENKNPQHVLRFGEFRVQRFDLKF